MNIKNHEIIIGDITVDVVKKNIKNLHLAVYPPTGRVRIAAPLRVNDEAIRLFIVSKIPWIKKQPEDLKIQKPLSLYPMKFDEVVDILLATKPKKWETKKRKTENISGDFR